MCDTPFIYVCDMKTQTDLGGNPVYSFERVIIVLSVCVCSEHREECVISISSDITTHTRSPRLFDWSWEVRLFRLCLVGVVFRDVNWGSE